MLWLELTLPTPAENLACDEALLDAVDAGTGPEVLRVWQPACPFIVLGIGNSAVAEVDLDRAKQLEVPVLRRCSGGGAVLLDSGCLNYSLILDLRCRPELATIAKTSQFIMNRHREMLAAVSPRPILVRGVTDLALDELKVSGNAQRRKRNAILFHGTFLLRVDFELMDSVLRFPSKQPLYRHRRPHREFLTSLPLDPDLLVAALGRAWNVDPDRASSPWLPPADAIARFVQEKYSNESFIHPERS